MSLTARAVALQGVGYGVSQIALQGMLAAAVLDGPTVSSGFARRFFAKPRQREPALDVVVALTGVCATAHVGQLGTSYTRGTARRLREEQLLMSV